jgi:ribosomal protein S18 acetylase RimI-like enzyme
MLENPLWQRYHVTPTGTEKMFTSALMEDATILTAAVAGQIAGFAWYALRGAWDRSAYLRLIGVLPTYQGMGIGERLMLEVEERVSGKVGEIFLLVTDSNMDAQRFYLRLGYQQVGSIPDYVVKGIAEFIFYKRLAVAGTSSADVNQNLA